MRDGSFNERLGIEPETPHRAPAPLVEPRDGMENTLIDLPGMTNDISAGLSSAIDFISNTLSFGDDRYTPIIPPTPHSPTPTHNPTQQTTPPPNSDVKVPPESTPNIPTATQLPFYGGTVSDATQPLPTETPCTPCTPSTLSTSDLEHRVCSVHKTLLKTS